MKVLTLVFLFRDNKILLAMKKRRFGAGKWNGYGGKLEEGEEILDGLVREVKEESDLVLTKDQFQELGFMDFYFKDKEEWNQRAVVYKVDDFQGEPNETEEMTPKWFELNKIPYDEMWGGDDQWIPLVVQGKKFEGEAHYENMGEKLIKISCVLK